jgi:alkyl hydroperoxide reductase subunit D
MTEALERLRESMPDAARDIKINLGNVLTPGSLDAAQVWGTAVASAYAARNRELTDAVVADATAAGVAPGVLEDARAAAVLMGMNNVYYRFRHVIGKEEYSQMPARLRMQRLAQVASNKADFELFCLAVSAINDCATCMASHEAAVLKHGLGPERVHDAVRIAATVHAAAIALEAR